MPGLNHHAVIHPKALLDGEKRAAGKINEWAATRLAVIFGAVWTVWVFFAWPLLAQFMSPAVQVKTSYYAQSWIQLFALPLFVWVGNRLQKSSDAQADAQYQALTHIAVTGDDVKTLLAQNMELTREVRDVAREIHQLTVQRELDADPLAAVAADARRAATAAESAFVATQVLASQATGPQPTVKAGPAPGKKPGSRM